MGDDVNELAVLMDACDLGGFNDAEETERVSRWALAEIERLRDALRYIAGGVTVAGYEGHLRPEDVAREALDLP